MRRLPLPTALLSLLLLGACVTNTFRPMRSGSGAVQPVKTISEIRAEAERGNPEAQFNLSMVYLEGLGSGTGSVRKDVALARQWLEKAAKGGFAKAQFNLGIMYYQGTDGVKRNLAIAREWFTKAAEGDDRLGQFNLGVMWYRGEGGPRDFMEAREYFEQATVQGHPEGAYNLGVMYAKGEGVKRDTIEAIAWFTIADAQGNPKANEVAGNLESALSPEDQRRASARSVELAKEIEKQAQSAR